MTSEPQFINQNLKKIEAIMSESLMRRERNHGGGHQRPNTKNSNAGQPKPECNNTIIVEGSYYSNAR